MEGPINKSVIDRLPSAVKGLNETCQKTYISLRLRKPEQEIARQLSISLDQAKEAINTVRSALTGAGQLDLIEDPHFVSIQSDDPDAPDIPVAAGELDIDDKLIIREFLSSLKEILNELPRHQSDILKLRYKYHMPAKDILGFCKKIGFSLVPAKEISGLKEQDIFYALNTALKEVFRRIKGRYNEERSIKLDNLKYIFEEIGI